MSREMKFIKPIPSIKSSTRAVKIQRFRKFDDLGLIVYSSTRLEDVPAAETFSVEDLIIVSLFILVYFSFYFSFFLILFDFLYVF